MIRVSNIEAPLTIKEDGFIPLIASKTGIRNITSCRIAKRSTDARKKNNIRFVFSFDITVDGDERTAVKQSSYPYLDIEIPDVLPVFEKRSLPYRPVVCGAGPAGMMAALLLAEAGARPLVVERGKSLENRRKDVDTFWKTGALNVDSNVQFGEGGAGAFSDGKLNTGIKKDAYVRKVLDAFVQAGAPEEILYLAHPHVGTDNLAAVVRHIREKIVSLGGEYRFETQFVGLKIKNGALTGIKVRLKDGREDEIATNALFLAVGHSARDTFASLQAQGVVMQPKAFAVGVRIEHKQSFINKSRYGTVKPPFPLGAADYKLVLPLGNGRTAYSFCMCPGGVVVGAASERNAVVTNGMSRYARDGENANSAFLINVTPDDFGQDGVLAGVSFQRRWERAAFAAGGGGYAAPAQRVEDFLNNRSSKTFGDVAPSCRPKAVPADLRSCLPEFVVDCLKAGLTAADKKIRGFSYPDAVLTGVETRSSSPVRILRNEAAESVGCAGLYPCGEGAGYAGGIVSAGADGLRCAEKFLQKS